ncbi:MAG: hypothetical protein NC244_10510 [Alistipes senegalensis]|nr:hypothetical protein [Alistipes senegalensis]
MYKFLFELATSPLGLPINSLYEYVILAFIGVIAYVVAYNKVGDMYHGGWIRGKLSGSFFHWLIRGICFFAMWFVAYVTIHGYFFVRANLPLVLMIAGGIVGTALLCAIVVSVMRFVKKHRTINGNV